jgi:hypothetical protein
MLAASKFCAYRFMNTSNQYWNAAKNELVTRSF